MASSFCTYLSKLSGKQIGLTALGAIGSINYARSEFMNVNLAKINYPNSNRVKYAQVEAHSPATFIKSFVDDWNIHSGQWKRPRDMSEENFYRIVQFEARHPIIKYFVRLAMIGKDMPKYKLKKTRRYY